MQKDGKKSWSLFSVKRLKIVGSPFMSFLSQTSVFSVSVSAEKAQQSKKGQTGVKK